jgi:hypothetical protein
MIATCLPACLPWRLRMSRRPGDRLAHFSQASGPSPVEQKLGQANTIERAINQHSMK